MPHYPVVLHGYAYQRRRISGSIAGGTDCHRFRISRTDTDSSGTVAPLPQYTARYSTPSAGQHPTTGYFPEPVKSPRDCSRNDLMAGRNGIPGIQKMRLFMVISPRVVSILPERLMISCLPSRCCPSVPTDCCRPGYHMLVMQTVCKQLQVIPRINQPLFSRVPATFIVRLPAVPVKH